MNLSLCQFLDTLPPIAVSREGDQSAYGQAGSLWFSLLKARFRQALSKKLRTGPCPHATYAVARSFQESE